MRKTAIIVIVTTFVLSLGTVSLAQTEHEHSGQSGDTATGQGMMGQGMMGQGMTGMMNQGMMPGMMMGGMMGKSMVSTKDGGVVVMIGNKLYKYDKDLIFKKEAEVEIDYQGMKNMMMKMQNMGTGTEIQK